MILKFIKEVNIQLDFKWQVIMESIKHIFKIGYGPSSSHTMGPQRAVAQFLKDHPDCNKFIIHLYGSLAATGRGHLTDKIILDTLNGFEKEIIWHPDIFLENHPNSLKIDGYINDKLSYEWTVYSIGGGDILDEANFLNRRKKSIYPEENVNDIINAHPRLNFFWEYVEFIEGKEIWDFLFEVWDIMKNAIEKGTKTDGTLPGPLKVARRASGFYIKSLTSTGFQKQIGKTFSYALAVAEENASGGKIVTAPTCGSCGVLPGVLKYLQDEYNFSDNAIVKALATAGLFGSMVKANASISGAEVGCQGEIGTACSMAGAAAAQLLGGTPYQIEYAAEMGIEHHLGLTCDPVGGYVQIPCIERNAVAAGRALENAVYAVFSDGKHFVSFDNVVKAMNETGKDINDRYRETSKGGLAKYYDIKEDGQN